MEGVNTLEDMKEIVREIAPKAFDIWENLIILNG